MVTTLPSRIETRHGLPRFPLAHAPTPLEPMDRLAAALGRPAGSLWVKRDDATGLALGGNKVRKLEYVVADALARGCDALVTGAGVQSNAARATAAAAARAGLSCTLVLDGEAPERASGNLVLDALLGAEVRFAPVTSHAELDDAMRQEVDRLSAAGRHPYLVAVGASTPLGALGYLDCAGEITAALPGATVVVATGSAGTQAGLAAGLGFDRVVGVRVGTRHDLAARVADIATDAALLAGRAVPRGEIRLVEDQLGEGYGVHTEACIEAMSLAARTEGLILDPVYTGKALAGLIAGCRDGRFDVDEPLVFVHTGGAPGLLSDVHGPTVAGAALARWRSSSS